MILLDEIGVGSAARELETMVLDLDEEPHTPDRNGSGGSWINGPIRPSVTPITLGSGSDTITATEISGSWTRRFVRELETTGDQTKPKNTPNSGVPKAAGRKPA